MTPDVCRTLSRAALFMQLGMRARDQLFADHKLVRSVDDLPDWVRDAAGPA